MTISTKILALTLLAALALAGCKKKDDDHDLSHGHDYNEEELITTLRALFVHATTGDTTVFSWVDLDGDGGNAPVITGGTVQMGAGYAMRLLLLNESVTPSDTISNEVAQEAEAHQFFFSTTGGSLGWEGYLDADANGLPIGLLTQWSTGVPGTGSLTIILRHGPNKSAAGVSAGDITNAGGATDIEVTMPYVVL